jgi:hypothetical protein
MNTAVRHMERTLFISVEELFGGIPGTEVPTQSNLV